jgi:PKD repeat protein
MLTVGKDGDSVNLTHNIDVSNVDPTIETMTGDTDVETGETASFGATATDPGDDTLVYTWDFGDGSPAGAGPNVNHVFATPGDYVVTLTVTEEDGGLATDTLGVHVEAPAGEPVEVVNVVFNGGAAQRTRIESVAVQFSEHVNAADLIASGDILSAVMVNGAQLPAAASFSYDSGLYMLTIDLTPAAGSYAVLSDGEHSLTFDSSLIHAFGDAGRTLAPTAAQGFHQWTGDFDGDFDLDMTDRSMWYTEYYASVGGPYDPDYDLNADGSLTLLDYYEWIQSLRRWNMR